MSFFLSVDVWFDRSSTRYLINFFSLFSVGMIFKKKVLENQSTSVIKRGFGRGEQRLGKVPRKPRFLTNLRARRASPASAGKPSKGARRRLLRCLPLPPVTREGVTRPAPGCDWTRRCQAPSRNTNASASEGL